MAQPIASIAYLFPGQGSQSVGMGRALVEQHRVAAETFAEADAILGFSLSELCFGGPAETLTETTNAQPAILTASVAAWRSLSAARSDLPALTGLAGHSLGEYSALVAAGALDFADAVRLTRTRGELMARAGAAHPGAMAAILKLDDAIVSALCAQAEAETGDVAQVANYNAPGQVVVSGGTAGVNAVMELVKQAGGRPRLLAVSIAAHSPLMASAAEEFARHVDATPFRAPLAPVVGNLSACPLETPEEIRAELVGQLTGSVQWTGSIYKLQELGAQRYVEVGPGDVLTGLVKRILTEPAVANVRNPEDIVALA
ncbi:MAG: ACP S-malonyltransferase [Anaerolineae bacterium]|jgi:[acyl-carrier-protein] S-malonyltransferase|nr:ACP S-malonyltransferase [Anaerolineae bacterium]